MKMIKLSAICTAVVLVLTSAIYVSQQKSAKRIPANFNQGKGFAVLELFTSEGCSSCPPADELLARIQKDVSNKSVYILAYHVDYWDRLGWKDVFSNSAFSKRQYWYHKKFTSQVYTPQLVINGTNEFVGSDESGIKRVLANHLDGKQPEILTLQAIQEGNRLTVQYKTSDKVPGRQMVIAVVQKHAVSNVKAGENESRTLSHVQIVRSLSLFEIDQEEEGTRSIAKPAGFNTRDWEVIGMTQNMETGEITSAARVGF